LMNPMIPTIIASILSVVLCRKDWRKMGLLAYVSGTMGALIGVDLVRMPFLLGLSGRAFFSIGGAGVLDGIFIMGIAAVVLDMIIVGITKPFKKENEVVA